MPDSTAPIPLLPHRSADRPVAYQHGVPISAERFEREVARLAAVLPARSHLMNLCSDRYRFAVGFAAALARGQVSLLPPTTANAMLQQIALEYPRPYALCDGAHEGLPFEVVMFPSVDASVGDETGVGYAEGGVPAPLQPIAPQQTAAIAFTSGSTGAPAAYPKTWGGLTAGARAEALELGLEPARPVVLVGTVPPQHMFGLESTVLLALANGFALHAGRPLFPADVAAALGEVQGERVLVTTPVHLRALLAAQVTLPRLRLILCATAPLPAELAAQAESRFGAPLHEIYGFTEVGMVATRRTVEGSAWRPLPGVSLREDAHGVWVRAEHARHEALAMDRLELRADGCFVLHGRSADLVNVAGKRTSLAYLAQQLAGIPGVQDAAFLMPDDTTQGVTRLTAFAVAPGVSREALLQALRTRVDAAFLPRPLHIVSSLPRSATGKLTREALLQLARRCAAEVGE